MKLSLLYYILYQIIDKVGVMTYKLALPLSFKIHNVLHVSLLRKHLGPITQTIPHLPPTLANLTILLQPKVVMDYCIIYKGKYWPRKDVLIKWSNALTEDVIWENEWCLTKIYPYFILTNKDF